MKRYKAILKEVLSDLDTFVATWTGLSNLGIIELLMHDPNLRSVRLYAQKNDYNGLSRFLIEMGFNYLEGMPESEAERTMRTEIKSFSSRKSINFHTKAALSWLDKIK